MPAALCLVERTLTNGQLNYTPMLSTYLLTTLLNTDWGHKVLFDGWNGVLDARLQWRLFKDGCNFLCTRCLAFN